MAVGIIKYDAYMQDMFRNYNHYGLLILNFLTFPRFEHLECDMISTKCTIARADILFAAASVYKLSRQILLFIHSLILMIPYVYAMRRIE